MEQVKIMLWSPHKAQREIQDSKARYKVVVAGRRFGKTQTAICILLKRALLQRDSKYFYIAPYYSQGKMIAWKILLDKLQLIPKELVVKTNETELVIKFVNGSEIFIKGGDRPDSLRGIGLDGVVLDEYADMRPNVWEEIIRPALVDKQGWGIFIGTPKGFNSFHELYSSAKGKEDWHAFHYTTYDNPYIKREEIDKLKAEMSDDKFNQEIMADFRRHEGLVYKEFIEATHVVDTLPTNTKEIIGGMDFGFNHPMAGLKVLVDGDGNYCIAEEYYKSGKTTSEMIEYVRTWNCEMWYPDPAEPDRIEEMRRAGFYCKDVIKNVPEGINRVRDLFKRNKLKIYKDCKYLIKELMTYAYDTDNPQRENPIKEMDDLCDSLRYILTMHAPKQSSVEYVFEEEKPTFSDIGI
jgi:PBSX family phage terminase large subunit